MPAQQILLAHDMAEGGGSFFTDNFDDNSRNISLWNETFSAITSAYDALVTVIESGGQVTITPRSSQTGNHYNGYEAVSAYDCTDKTVTIELVTGTTNTTNVDTRFGLIIDANNYVAFHKGNASVTMRVRNGGANSEAGISGGYDSTAHRWLRLRHSSATNQLFFETSPDNSTWTTRRTVATPGFGMTALKPFLAAGTFGSVTSPGTAVFDNFSSDLA